MQKDFYIEFLKDTKKKFNLHNFLFLNQLGIKTSKRLFF